MELAFAGIAPLLQVYDMPRSLAFYRDKLGFSIMEQSTGGDDCDWVLLSLSNVELMLNTAYERQGRPEKPDETRIKVHADTCLYFGCPDIEGTYQALINNGLNIEKPIVTHYNFKAINLTDPDGYLLCFHWPLNQK